MLPDDPMGHHKVEEDGIGHQANTLQWSPNDLMERPRHKHLSHIGSAERVLIFKCTAAYILSVKACELLASSRSALMGPPRTHTSQSGQILQKKGKLTGEQVADGGRYTAMRMCSTVNRCKINMSLCLNNF